jgi:molybdopterin/thiamine biosynthesis adenylyltransferase
MVYAEELVVSRVDLAALRLEADKRGVAFVLIGHSQSGAATRYLVAEILQIDLLLKDLSVRCRAEGMGLLEVRPDCTAGQADARLAELADDLPETPLVILSANMSTAWRWDAQQRRSVALTGLRLIGADEEHRSSLLERVLLDNKPVTAPSYPRLQRQLTALGEAGQHQLSVLTVAIVGCGGTGSQLAQLLALGGVGRLLLVDDDYIEQSNRNRLVAATDLDIRHRTAKVTALRRHLEGLTPDVAIVELPWSLYDKRSTISILSADVLVGCTDNEGSRLHLNYLAVQHLLPYIDCGAGIEYQGERLVAGGQIRAVLPGGPCLECYGGIDRWRAARDLATPREHLMRRTHGYGLGEEQAASALAFLNASIAAEAAASVVAIATGLRSVVPFLAYDLIAARLAPREDVQRSPACSTCAPDRRYGRGDTLQLPLPGEDIQLPSPKTPVAHNS